MFLEIVMPPNPYTATTESNGEEVRQKAAGFVAAAWQFHLSCILLLAASLFLFEDGRAFLVLATGQTWQFLFSVVSLNLSWEINSFDLFASAYRMLLCITLCCHAQAYYTGFTSKMVMLPSSLLLTTCHAFIGAIHLITLDPFCWFVLLYCCLSVAVAFGLVRQDALEL
jgi:hypothetical protein